MAEPKTAEWWEAQWNQLKRELDEVNPKLDAAIKKHADDKAAHEAAMVALGAQHVLELSRIAAKHAADKQEYIEAANRSHAKEIADLKAALIPQLQDLQARQKAEAVAKMDVQHAAELAKLK